MFFKTIRKQLENLRNQFQNNVEQLQTKSSKTSSGSSTSADEAALLANETQEIYISLYLAEGSNISKWESFLNSLVRVHSVSRPVYDSEKNIIDIIRSKDYKQNDAYIALKISKLAILRPYNDKPPLDRYGHSLLVLKEGSIRPENIERFVHISGLYHWVVGKLVRKESADFLK